MGRQDFCTCFFYFKFSPRLKASRPSHCMWITQRYGDQHFLSALGDANKEVNPVIYEPLCLEFPTVAL